MKNIFFLMLAAAFLASPLAAKAGDHAVDCKKAENHDKEECKKHDAGH